MNTEGKKLHCDDYDDEESPYFELRHFRTARGFGVGEEAGCLGSAADLFQC